jgi:hypothetical protein
MGLLKDKYEQVKASIAKFFASDEENAKRVIVEIPEEGSDTISDFVQALWDEGESGQKDHFRETTRMRPRFGLSGQGYTADPQTWKEHCERLIAGRDWEVVGRRNSDPKHAWKQEVVTGMIADKMRVRRQYITSNYHDVTISPNPQHLDSVFEQERKAWGWGEFVDDWASAAMQYGSATERAMVDCSENPQGHIVHIVCDQLSVVRTPNTKSFKKRDGCWYAVHGMMVNHQYIQQNFPDIDVSELVISDSYTGRRNYRSGSTIRSDYTHTRMYAKYDCFLDDDTLEKIPFSEEEEIELAAEHTLLIEGKTVPAREEQNHLEHVKSKAEALRNFLSQPELQDETLVPDADMVYANSVIDAYTLNVIEHTQMMRGDELASRGLRYKYPAGRYIEIVGTVKVKDEPNPYCNYESGILLDWRKLFCELKNEKVQGRNDGKSDTEILFENNHRANTALSRFADTVLLAMPKIARQVSDKGTGNSTFSNDPTEHIWFHQTPPVMLHAQVSGESLKEYEIATTNADKASAVNDITIAGEPKGQSSGYQTALLQRQNAMIVTGELDRNLRDAIEEIVETDIELWRVFFTDDRPYFIGAEQVPINVAKVLEPYRKFQINVRPFSNHPFRW